MARQVNGHLGTFASIEALTAKFPPSESIGCSANVGTAIPYTKAWCDGSEWALVKAPQIQALVSGGGIRATSRNLKAEYKAAVYALTATITEGGSQTVGNTGLQANNAVFRYSNNLMAPVTGLVSQVGVAYTGRNRADPTGLLTTEGSQWAVEFDYYGQILEPYLYGAAGVKYWYWVDGAPLTAAPAALTAVNTMAWVHIDFGSAAKRRIRIEGHGVNAAFNAVRSGSTVFVTAPDEARPPVLGWVGDSYGDGRKATNEMTGFVRSLGRMLGLEAWQFPCAGGQGLVVGATHISRMPTDLVPIPNLRAVVIQASINDAGGSWSGNVGPAAVAAVSFVKANCPATAGNIAVVSPLAVLSLSTYQTMSNQIRDALALAHPDVPYIDLITTPWVSGAGKVGTTTGLGISDVVADADGTHPTQLGHDMLAEILGSRLRSAWSLPT